MIKNNSGLVSEGAYQWALLEKTNYGENKPVKVNFMQWIKNIKNHDDPDAKIMIFESTLNKSADPILMVEWLDQKNKKTKVSFYPLKKKGYEEMKRENGIVLELFLMNGRIRYQEELSRGTAFPPTIVVAS